MHPVFAQLPDYDPETDQYNTANRHYSPSGRWLTPDPGGLKAVHPADPQTWNMYAYVRNNPTTLTDPSGLDWFWVDKKWQWQKGHKFVDADTGEVLSTKGYRYLLQFEKTRTDKGTTFGNLTLLDQKTPIASSTGFSGGAEPGRNGLANGGYMIRLDLPITTAGPNDVKLLSGGTRGYLTHDNAWGVQNIPSNILGFNFQGLWGTRRAALNQMPGETGEDFQWNFLHGRTNLGDETHNCICDRSEKMMDEILTLGPNQLPGDVK
jgi:RHS repeat-associated protein